MIEIESEEKIIFFLITSENNIIKKILSKISYLESIHFSNNLNNKIYNSILFLFKEKEKIDAFTVSKQLNLDEQEHLIKILETHKKTSCQEVESIAASLYHNYYQRTWEKVKNTHRNNYLDSKTANLNINNLIMTKENYDNIMPPKKFYPWLPAEGGLVMIYSKTGTGKTLFILFLIKYLLETKKFYEWDYMYHKKPIILYIDGEMDAGEQKERMQKIGIKIEDFFWLSHEKFIFRGDKKNITDSVLNYCIDNKVDILIIDTIVSNIGKSDISKYVTAVTITNFLLSCRRNKITVIFTNQGNKYFSFRGHSVLIDTLNTNIVLLTIYNNEEIPEGFKLIFEKMRTFESTYVTPIIKIIENTEKQLEISFSTEKDFDYKRMLELIKEFEEVGIYSQDIVDQLSLSKTKVSRYKKRMEKEGLIKIQKNIKAPLKINREE